MENGGAEKAELRIEGQGCFLASLLRRLRFLQEPKAGCENQSQESSDV